VTLVVLLGGARAGKSRLAVELAQGWNGPVAYVATAEAGDDEMARRIEQHRARRPREWTTIEEPLGLRAVLAGLDGGTLAVLDCLTLWVANLMARGDPVLAEAEAVAALAAERPVPVIAVTNEVGLGIVPASPLGREYRDVLGSVNATFVRRASDSAFVVAGRPLALGSDWFPEALRG
jgi:adenosyl cobinamide kinase/adenosyl cobinamide phosphate guanylyltransferase